MKEYIERETILKTPPFTKCVSDLSEYAEGYLDCVEDACEAVKKTPAADVAPVVHGEWRPETDEEEPNPMFKLVVCSCCDSKANHTYNFCPNCGAHMDGGNK